jgi:hypothetical protein
MNMVLLGDLRVVAVRGYASLLMGKNDFSVCVNGHHHWASKDVNRFCKLLTTYWPVQRAESYRWMIQRLAGGRCLYADSCDGQTAAVNGKPVNIFGLVVTHSYAPIDDWDNLVDVIGCIWKAYG